MPGFQSFLPQPGALKCLLPAGASAKQHDQCHGGQWVQQHRCCIDSNRVSPTGVTATFSPAITGTSSTLSFAASSSTVAGTYTVTVTGTSGTVQSTATIALTIPGPISIAITQPEYGFNVIPGSVRRIYGTVSNGLTGAINWSVTGGASLSSSVGNWVDVTAPATGSSCSINGTENYSVTSAKQFTLTATAQENST